jgi:hypothetical protein
MGSGGNVEALWDGRSPSGGTLNRTVKLYKIIMGFNENESMLKLSMVL